MSADSPPAALAPTLQPSRKERLLVTLLVALGLFIDYTLLTVVVPIFPEVKKNLKLSNFAIGCLFAVKPALQAVTDPLLAPLIDRGWVWPLAVGLAAEAGTTVIFAYATTYEAMMVSRASQGIASALIMTTGLAMVARVHNDDDKQRGIALSRAFFGVAAGVSLGPPLGGFLYTAGGSVTTFLILTAICAVIFVVAVCITLWHVRQVRVRAAHARRYAQQQGASQAAKGDGGEGEGEGKGKGKGKEKGGDGGGMAATAVEGSEPKLSGTYHSPMQRMGIGRTGYSDATEKGRGPFARIFCDKYMMTVYGALFVANAGIGMLEPMISLFMEEVRQREI